MNQQFTRVLVIIAVSLLVLIGGIFVALFFLTKKTTVNSGIPTPTPQTSFISTPTPVTVIVTPLVTNSQLPFQRDSAFDKSLAPNSEPSRIALNSSEAAYADAVPQVFQGRDSSQTGTLVVTSTVQGANVTIDIPGSGESAAQVIPHNATPFKLQRIPAGYYTINAAKDSAGGVFVILIEPNMVTRLQLNLQNSQGSPGD